MDAEPTGYAPPAIARWAAVAREWAEGGTPEAFPLAAEPIAAKPRDTFLFYIGGAKVRAPHAAMATIAALG